jgi:macrolide phosphotransferase
MSPDRFIETLGKTLAQLHRSPAGGATADGIIALTPTEVREGFRAEFERVNDELGMREELASFCREWLDEHARWPTETVLIHGDLYAGHVTADANSEVSGIIDWTEAKVSDAALDFAGHLAAFDPESLGKLLAAYERHGGKTWPRIGDQIEARHRASPIRYGLFALETQNEEHLAAAKAQLGSR